MNDSEAFVHDELFDSMLTDFLDESGQLLDRLNENLLQLDEWVRSLDDGHEQRCDEELLNEMFRAAHSLKGLSAMLGLGNINNLTHKIENVFDAARKDELVVNGDVVEMIFQGVDRLVGLVELLKDPDAEPVEYDSIVDEIRQMLESAGVDREQTSQADAEQALRNLQDEANATPTADITSPTPSPNATSEADPFGGLEDETEISDTYLSIFIDESEQSLESLTETLLALEGGGRREELKDLLITSHRIKGAAASVGLNRAAKLAHLMEDLLQNLVENGGALSTEVTDAMLKCTDGLRSYLRDLRNGGAASDEFALLARELLLAQSAGAAAGPSSSMPSDTADSLRTARDDVQAAFADASEKLDELGDVSAFVGDVRFQPELPLVALKAQLVYEKLSRLGEVFHFDPPLQELDDLEELDHVRFGITCDQGAEVIRRQLRIGGVRAIEVEPLAVDDSEEPARQAALAPAPSEAEAVPTESRKAAIPAATQSAPPQKSPGGKASSEKRSAPDGGTRPAETLRVDIERLDQLMNLSAQLVIHKARFAQIGDHLKQALGSKQSTQALNRAYSALEKMNASHDGRRQQQDLCTELDTLRNQSQRVQHELETVRRDMEALGQARMSLNDLFETIHQLDRVSNDIQQSVMDTRMLPIGPLLNRFKRVIRDITRSNGKSVGLVINGEKTELDKRMIDELGDPLIHMVRNAADHGIEPPEVREAAGKPRQGTVTLDAFHRGNSIVIQVSDDGKGLDPDVIARKAVEKGLLAESEIEKMSRHQIYQLIWEPGLSTAKQVTEVSGRGMGMDIVRSKIEELNGTVDLDSELGKGTTMTIRLPLTLAILPSLMVQIEGDIFAMPLESVVEIVNVAKSELTTVHQQWTAQVRGRVISMVQLGEIFTFGRRRPSAGSRGSEETTLVVVQEHGSEVGLAVDRVIGEEDIVIKSLAENFRNVPGISGASILGDGRVSLILDLAALIEMASNTNTVTPSS